MGVIVCCELVHIIVKEANTPKKRASGPSRIPVMQKAYFYFHRSLLKYLQLKHRHTRYEFPEYGISLSCVKYK